MKLIFYELIFHLFYLIKTLLLIKYNFIFYNETIRILKDQILI